MNNKDKVWFLELVVKAQKSKIERAIEYLKEHSNNCMFELRIEEMQELLDILEGKDETNN